MENQEMYPTQKIEPKVNEMLTIKFSRKLARPFTSKSGKDMVSISIPNQDPNDNRPWEAFVLPVTLVHSDHYGSKTIWASIPANGNTVLSRTFKPSNENGAWEKTERTVDNKTLKSMVEAYKLKPKTQPAR